MVKNRKNIFVLVTFILVFGITPKIEPLFSPAADTTIGAVGFVCCSTLAIYSALNASKTKELLKIDSLLSEKFKFSPTKLKELQNSLRMYNISMYCGAVSAVPFACLTGYGIHGLLKEDVNPKNEPEYNEKLSTQLTKNLQEKESKVTERGKDAKDLKKSYKNADVKITSDSKKMIVKFFNDEISVDLSKFKSDILQENNLQEFLNFITLKIANKNYWRKHSDLFIDLNNGGFICVSDESKSLRIVSSSLSSDPNLIDPGKWENRIDVLLKDYDDNTRNKLKKYLADKKQ